ncbi:unnamed protein product [Amoebophrya sp. A25]|nr:unnamed protein product [Amoebophrya sp. A25]|eukprot:GSA25T00024894001.1
MKVDVTIIMFLEIHEVEVQLQGSLFCTPFLSTSFFPKSGRFRSASAEGLQKAGAPPEVFAGSSPRDCCRGRSLPRVPNPAAWMARQAIRQQPHCQVAKTKKPNKAAQRGNSWSRR